VAPLSGIRVVELSRVLAGPWAGQLLADLGAEVIKVESLAGDDTRAFGPPFVEYTDGGHDAAYYHSCNRGKRSIALDLSTTEGQAVVARLAANADVLTENFRVGTLKRFGLDHARLGAANPRLVYCSITGFGQDGPKAALAGYDFLIQGMGGIMHLTGDASGPPQKIGVAFADIFAGLYAVTAIEAALIERERTGRGQYIDMALLDAQVGVLANQAMNFLVTGRSPRRMGNAHPNIVPYQSFAAADGDLIIAVANDLQFRKLAAILGVPALTDDPDFATNAARVVNRAVLVPKLVPLIAAWKSAELLARLAEAGIPAGPINTIDEVFADPQVRHRGMRIDLPLPGGGTVPAVRTPITMESALVYERPSPRVGEHSRELLAELGYPPDEIERLVAARVVGTQR
jgi:crotonobetainyl-CoA:carnitine CoA-transferase CaiB-like acyl-CoA transferase